ncbi:MAG: glutaredoxin family protein [Smithellaceae bacterium]
MNKCFFFFFALLIIFTATAHADFYTWEDETGAVHITDYPPPQIKSDQNVKVHKRDAPSTAGVETAVEKKPDIILFTKNDCPDCDKAKDFLKSKNMPFTEYNMDTNEDAVVKRKDFDESNDVPFAVINRFQVYGFSETVYNRVLNLKP